jgi:hypothetical protein
MRREIKMKKKIVNVLLSATIVTSMMFGVTACGAKDTTPAPAEDAAVTNTVATNESSVADTDAADESTVADTDAADESSVADTDAADESSVADTDAADDEAAAGNGNVEDWVNSEMASTYVEALDMMFGGQVTTGFEVNGDALVLVVVMSEEMVGIDSADSLSDDDMELIHAKLEEEFASVADQFVPVRDQLRGDVGDDSLTVQMSYRLSDGTELYLQEL